MNVALITRVSRLELPYIESFLAHYRNIGVSKIYFVIHRNDAELFQKMGANVIIRNKKDPNHRFSGLLKEVNEEFCFHFDADEYLDVYHIDEMNVLEGDNFKFRWRMYIHDGSGPTVFRGNRCKGLVLTRAASRACCHGFVTGTGPKMLPYPLIHYWPRGYPIYF